MVMVASMNYEQRLIRARFIEAADTEWRMPSAKGPARVKSFWPEFAPTEEDIAGWGQDVREERYRETKALVKSIPDRDAIARHDECMDWTVSILTSVEHRKVIWGWAYCILRDKPFSAWCDKNKVVRMTAYRRLERAVDLLVSHLCKGDAILSAPDEYRVLHLWPSYDMKSSMVGEAYDSAA